jgi:hypothetical protein
MRLIDDSSECNFLDNRKQKYQLLSAGGEHNGNLRVLVCDIYHF